VAADEDAATVDKPLTLTPSPPEAAVEEADVSVNGVSVEDDPVSVEDDPESVEDDPESVEDDPESVEDDPESVEDDPESDMSVDEDESAVVVVVEEELEEPDDPLLDEEPLFSLLIINSHFSTSWTAGSPLSLVMGVSVMTQVLVIVPAAVLVVDSVCRVVGPVESCLRSRGAALTGNSTSVV